ncbi:MAG: YihY family inner membrane protein [Deltaproteobacteria bacterium]|nr:YihY family inner membrane protein [Deltaproteobacteria bacterium]
MAASSLAYQTALALVPLLAVGLALLKSSGQLGAGSTLVEFLVQQLFPSSADGRAEIVSRLSQFSDKIAAGAVGSFGLVTSIAVGFFLFLSVESIWNRIWESQRERTYVERFLLFYTGITLLPFVVAVSFLHTASLFGKYAFTRLFLSVFSTALVLSLANRLVPTLRVRWKAAIAGGVTAAIILEVTKFGMGLYLTFVTGSYRSIYGALGVLPLFLLSIYVSWLILLWGVEVSRAVQRLPLLRRSLERGDSPNEDPSIVITGQLAARLLCDVARHFKDGNKHLSIYDIQRRHGLPESIVQRVMKHLATNGLVLPYEDGFLLARPPEAIRLHEVLRLFQPSAHRFAQAEPDALDRVLVNLDRQTESNLEAITFASLL